MSDTDRVVTYYAAAGEGKSKLRLADIKERGIVDPEICEHVDLLLAQLEDANATIEQQRKQMMSMERAYEKLMMEAARARPLAEPEPEAFPARALRFSA